MKNLTLSIGLLLSACSTKEPVQQQNEKMLNKETISPSISYSNPALYAGTTILHSLQACSNSQRYDLMMQFTSDSILKSWGKDSVLHYYQYYDFGYRIIKLKSMTQDKDVYTLLYLTSSYATKRQTLVRCVTTNDTAKIILPITIKRPD